MTTAKRRTFWDSCVFIRLLSVTKDPAKLAEREICKFCLQDAIDLNGQIGNPPMKIVKPHFEGQKSLFLDE